MGGLWSLLRSPGTELFESVELHTEDGLKMAGNSVNTGEETLHDHCSGLFKSVDLFLADDLEMVDCSVMTLWEILHGHSWDLPVQSSSSYQNYTKETVFKWQTTTDSGRRDSAVTSKVS